MYRLYRWPGYVWRLTHIRRPVVLGPLVRLVLAGDVHTGILTGGTLELVWMGLAARRRTAA
ncbi:PTS sugar transporter subunit IIC [Escherichia coli]